MKKISWRLFHKVGSYLDVSMGKLLPPRCWAESNSRDWNRVNIFENLGVTTVVPVAPIVTFLGLIQNYKMNWAMKWFDGALTVKLQKVHHATIKTNNCKQHYCLLHEKLTSKKKVFNKNLITSHRSLKIYPWPVQHVLTSSPNFSLIVSSGNFLWWQTSQSSSSWLCKSQTSNSQSPMEQKWQNANLLLLSIW